MRQEIDPQASDLGSEILEEHINAAAFPSNWENSDISITGSGSAAWFRYPV
jgi:hypothetical protein